MTAYYNENDKHAAAWLRELIKEGAIAPGDVDERSITEVEARDLEGYTQCHFFAGVGVWSHALHRAGVSDDTRVWTGSCPCQPFSAAGKQKGLSDERHLWPAWFRLIEARRPKIIFGEQVASAIGSGLQKVWGQQGFLEFSQERIQGESPESVQGMQEQRTARTAREPKDIDTVSSASDALCSENASEGIASSLRFRRGVDPRQASDGKVRSYRNCIRHGTQTGLEHTIARQDHPIEGVHQSEYTSRHLRAKHSVRKLGRAASVRNSARDIGAEKECFECFVEEACRKLEEENRRTWIGVVRSDLERIGYTFGACNTPAAGFGAPHVRQRAYFVGLADADGRREGDGELQRSGEHGQRTEDSGTRGMADAERDGRRTDESRRGPEGREINRRTGADGSVADTDRAQRNGRGKNARTDCAATSQRQRRGGTHRNGIAHDVADAARSERRENQEVAAGGEQASTRHRDSGTSDDVGNAARGRRGEFRDAPLAGDRGYVDGTEPAHAGRSVTAPSATNGFWSDAVWIACTDGFHRPTQPEIFPLVNGPTVGRVGALRGAGNALVAPVAQAFIESVMEELSAVRH